MPEGEKRDCEHKTANHQHGTVNAYVNDRCRCAACRRALADRAAERRKAAHLGTLRAQCEPSVRTLERIDALRLAGWTLPELARRFGYANPRSIRHLYSRASIHSTTARKIKRVHDRLIHLPPPAGYHGAAKRAATFARRRLDMPDPPADVTLKPPRGSEIVEDFLHIASNGLGVREASKIGWTAETRRNLAPRLGVTVEALDRALYRAA